MLRKILVVDDDTTIRHLLNISFTKKNYEVTTAEDAEKALQILDRQVFPVIFLDLQLPGLSGLELCKIIRKHHPLSFIFAMTAFISLFDLTECREAGFDDYFTKPLNLEMIHKATADAFEKIERWKERARAKRLGSPAGDDM